MKRHSVSLVSPQWSHAQLLLQRHQAPVGLPVDSLAPSCGCMAQLYNVTLAAMVFFFFLSLMKNIIFIQNLLGCAMVYITVIELYQILHSCWLHVLSEDVLSSRLLRYSDHVRLQRPLPCALVCSSTHPQPASPPWRPAHTRSLMNCVTPTSNCPMGERSRRSSISPPRVHSHANLN